MSKPASFFLSLDNELYYRSLVNTSQNEEVRKFLGIKEGFPSRVFFKLIPFFIVFNSLVTLVLICIKFFTSIILSVFRSKKIDLNEHRVCLFFTHLFYDRFHASDIDKDNIIWIAPNSLITKVEGVDPSLVIKIQDLLSPRDYKWVFRYCFSDIIKSFKLDVIYPLYNIWDYYAAAIGLGKFHYRELYFANQSDRWALLFDTLLSDSKVLIQHGIEYDNITLPHKLNTIDIVYALGKNTWQGLFSSVLSNNPELRFLKPSITLTELEGTDNSLLIVSHIRFFEIEKEIISELSAYNIKIIIKKHPTVVKDDCYKELAREYDAIYLTEKVFPKVNAVVSYFSTLAFEYMSCDIPVYIYDERSGLNKKTLSEFLEKYYTKKNDSE